ncbi:hypothetical protein QRX50_20210 [Amycolatopsis carbonis]|uniref:Uncharacterized protein n=1 Tax=Amycolatopsis carbonis TaxID=715471 RepID=A0A9Y2IN76_9PSEU|nr:hypothetical protein [Amycolatopsis sp. 2-15]WIX82922.1 hypothetical protein QRX50_20210 [Amycolatopsis sp. 2-15]
MAGQKSGDGVLIGRSYTRSRRFPRMFGRMPGRDGGYLPGGPYTLTQGVLFLGLLVIVWKVSAFDWLGPARWGLPLGAIFVRRARIESRTPLGWLAGLVMCLLAPATGLLGNRPYRAPRPQWSKQQIHLHLVQDRANAAPLERILAGAGKRGSA